MGMLMTRWPFYWLRRRCTTCSRRKPVFTAFCDRCWFGMGER